MKSNKKILSVIFVILLIIIVFFIQKYTEKNTNNSLTNSIKSDKITDKNKENIWEEELADWGKNLDNLDNLDLEKIYSDAEKYFNEKNYKKATEKLELYLTYKGDSLNAYEDLAKSYYFLWKYDKTIEIYKNLIIKNPSNDSYYGHLWSVFNKKGDKEKWSLFLIIWFLLNWKDLKLTDLDNENDKKMYNLEYETIKEFVNNKEYDDLREYIFYKYLWEKSEQYDIENN